MRPAKAPVRSALAALAAGALLELAGVAPAVLGAAGLEGAPLRVVALWLVLLPVAYVAIRVRRRRRPVPEPTPHGGIAATPPDDPKWQGHLDRFGVYWTAIYGRRTPDHPIEGAAGAGRGRSDGGEEGSPHRPDYAHVVGPFCPECATAMRPTAARHWLLFSRPVWKCSDCGAAVPRPEEAAFHEAADVRALVEAALEPVYYGGADRATVDDREGFFTAHWDE